MYDLERFEIRERFAHVDQFRYCGTCNLNRARQLTICYFCPVTRAMWVRAAVGMGVGIEDGEVSESWTLGHKSCGRGSQSPSTPCDSTERWITYGMHCPPRSGESPTA